MANATFYDWVDTLPGSAEAGTELFAVGEGTQSASITLDALSLYAGGVTVDTVIPGLGAAAALTGAEEVLVIQGGAPLLTTAQDIADLAAGGGVPAGQPAVLGSGAFILPKRAIAGSQVLAANLFIAQIIFFEPGQTLDAMAVFVDTAVGGSSIKACLYDATATGGLPGAKVTGSDCTISTAATGIQVGTFAGDVGPLEGWFWCAGVSSSNATIRGIAGTDGTQVNIWGSTDFLRVGSPTAVFTAKSGTTTFAAGCPDPFGAAADYPATTGGASGSIGVRAT